MVCSLWERGRGVERWVWIQWWCFWSSKLAIMALYFKEFWQLSLASSHNEHWNIKWALSQENLSSGVSNHARLKPACSATETRWGLDISTLTSSGIILSWQRTTKAQTRLRGCAGWSVPLLFAYGKSRFCHDLAQIIVLKWNCYMSWRVNSVKNSLLHSYMKSE